MATTFAVPDLHGRHDLFEEAVAAAEAREPDAAARTIVFLGDYVDRGPRSRQIVERLMAGPGDGSTWVALSGNHEDIMVQAMLDPDKVKWWIDNGAAMTLFSYGTRDREAAKEALARVPREHVQWLADLPTYHADAKRLFVHAGVDPSAREQLRETLLWKLYVDGFPLGFAGLHVVHGHHVHEDGPHTWGERTNLDTGAHHSGRLAVGVFDDDVAGGPVEIMWVKGATGAEYFEVARRSRFEEEGRRSETA